MNKATRIATGIALSLGIAMQAGAQTGNVEAGRKAFGKCVYCHQVGPSARNVFGPHLNGIVGRRAGSIPNYRYSAAMTNAGITWTEEKLRAFVRTPGKIIPNSNMRFYGLWSDKEAADLVAYLRTLK